MSILIGITKGVLQPAIRMPAEMQEVKFQGANLWQTGNGLL